MDYTEQDFLRALSLAKRDGNEAAASQVRSLYRQWMFERDQKENDPTAGMSTAEKVAANLGAGMTNVVEGTKQLFGMASSQDMRDKAAIDQRLAESQTLGGLTQGVGTAAMFAPAAFIPGANTVAGSAMIGGGIGALEPTANENVALGKATNAAGGAAVGAAMQKGAQMVGEYAPRAYNAVLDWWSKKGLPGASTDRQVKIAERAFRDSVPTDSRLRLMQYEESVPGVKTSTAAALNDTPLLAAERAARETAGTPANILRQQEVANNAARWDYIKGIGGDASAAKEGARTWFRGEAAKLKPRGTIDERGRIVATIDALIDRYGQTSPAAAEKLNRVRESIANGLLANNGKGDIRILHDARMYSIDDQLTSLASSDAKAARAVREELMGVKQALDAELNRVTSGRWSKLMQGYAARMRMAEQMENANTLVGKLGATDTTVTGEPLVTSSMRTLRTASQNAPQGRFNTPPYSSADASRISTLTADAERQLAPFKVGVAPRNSATAANALETGPNNLMQHLRRYPQATGGDVEAAAVGSLVTGSPKGAVMGWLGNQARLWAGERSSQARDVIAGRIAGLLADQGEAYRLLESLNPVLRQQVLQHWTRQQIPMTGLPGAVGAMGGVLGSSLVPATLGTGQ